MTPRQRIHVIHERRFSMKNKIASDLIKEIESEGLKIEEIGREVAQLAQARNEAFSDLLPLKKTAIEAS